MDEPQKKIKKQKPKKRIRNKLVKFFLTEKELELLDNRCQKAEMNRSEFLRECSLKKELIINKTEVNGLQEFQQFQFQIKRVGANLHQTLKKINMYDNFNEAEFEELEGTRKELDVLIDEINGVIGETKKWLQ